MSEVFDGYEPQYCELSVNLSNKCSSASLLSDQGQKQQKLTDITTGLDEADILIRKMDLEARSLQPNMKAMLLAKLREYKADLNNLKREVKKISSPSHDQSARDELLEAGMADSYKLHEVDNAIDKSKKILTAMSRRISKNKWIFGGIIGVLLLAVIFIIYFKLTH